MSLPTQKIRLTFSGKSERLGESAIEDDDRMDYMGDEDGEEEDEAEQNSSKLPQARRASEGQHIMKDGKKPSSSDLKCDKCGKGYKHSSCLSKHLFVPTFFPFLACFTQAIAMLIRHKPLENKKIKIV